MSQNAERPNMSDNRFSTSRQSFTVEVTKKLSSEIRLLTIVMGAIILLSMLPLLGSFHLAESTPGFSTMPSSEHRFVLSTYGACGLVISYAIMWLTKFIFLRLIANRVAALVYESHEDDDLWRALRERLTKTFFVYVSDYVPFELRRTRLSGKPNADGTYWMMKVNKDFSKLTFQKYRTGEIAEPRNPDDLAGRYPWLSSSTLNKGH